MALSQSVLSELLDASAAGERVDLIRDAVQLVLQELIEVEASEQIGAGRYERRDTRVTERDGSRPRLLTTQAGDVGLRIPKRRRVAATRVPGGPRSPMSGRRGRSRRRRPMAPAAIAIRSARRTTAVTPRRHACCRRTEDGACEAHDDHGGLFDELGVEVGVAEPSSRSVQGGVGKVEVGDLEDGVEVQSGHFDRNRDVVGEVEGMRLGVGCEFVESDGRRLRPQAVVGYDRALRVVTVPVLPSTWTVAADSEADADMRAGPKGRRSRRPLSSSA